MRLNNMKKHERFWVFLKRQNTFTDGKNMTKHDILIQLCIPERSSILIGKNMRKYDKFETLFNIGQIANLIGKSITKYNRYGAFIAL